MFYPFPVGLTLDEVRDVVNRHNDRCGVKAFIEADKGSYVVFNYVISFDGSFPHPASDLSLSRDYAILRECRGLLMSKDTGRPIARRFQKFFNVNEKPETQITSIDWTRPHLVLEKLDGSMLTPFLPDGERMRLDAIRWGTKMGTTDVAAPVEEFVRNNQQYAEMARHEMDHGWTPIFEWCSRKQKIVIDYPEDSLILTAVRNNETGEYYPYQDMVGLASNWDIPVVRALPGSVENIHEFMVEAKDIEGAEGYVIRFDDGHMCKVKGEWYCRIHNTKDMLTHEKDVWALILEDRMDDAKAFMDGPDKDAVERFQHAMETEIAKKGTEIASIVGDAKVQGMDKKSFALNVALKASGLNKGLLFSVWDGQDPAQAVRGLLSRHTGTGTKVEEGRNLISNIRWSDFRASNNTDE